MAAATSTSTTAVGAHGPPHDDESARIRIRYACKCGRLAPLSRLFFSDLCQRLVCRAPGCSVEEFESYYCGYLLVNLPSKEASMYQNRSSRCFACVACGNVLSTVFHEARRRYFFACAHCHWDSLALGLEEEDPDMLLMTAVAREREADHEDLFHTLLTFHSAQAAATATTTNAGGGLGFGGRAGAVPSYIMPHSGVAGGGAAGVGHRLNSFHNVALSMKELQREQQMKKFRLQRMVEMGTFKYEDAVAHERERVEWLEDQRHEHEWPELRPQMARFEVHRQESDDDLEAIARQGDMSQVSTLAQRLQAPLEQNREIDRVFPHRPPLRVKRTWRCVESIARGSAGILVKPQISPMSGDSSLPIPASWFKKANLGVHFVPIFTFQVLPKVVAADGEALSLESVLLVENPLDESIQVVCYQEPANSNATICWENFSPVHLGPYEDPTIADAFASDARPRASSTEPQNAYVISSTRNLVKLRAPVQLPRTVTGTMSFRIRVEMVKYDDALQEAVDGSNFTFSVQLEAPVPRTDN